MKLKNLLANKIFKNQFLAGSLIMIIGSNFYNAGQFLYHIIAGNILGRAHYGDLAALINILGIFSLIQMSLSLTIVKFVASEKDRPTLIGIIRWAFKWSGVFGLLIFVLLLISAPFINNFLHISQLTSIYLLAPVILFYSIITIGRSVLQGMLRFGWNVTSLMIEIIVKVVLMVPLVIAGYAVVGAMWALLIGVISSFVVVVYSLKSELLDKVSKNPKTAPLIKYSIPAFLQGLALTSMYTTDLFLVKHFFSQDTAGLYAALEKLGTIVFFGTSPVSQVMFPHIAKRHAHGETYHKIFYLSVLLTVLVSFAIIFLYLLFPKIFLSAFGPGFVEGAGILWWFGLFMALLALAGLCVQFYLSIGKTFVVGLFLLAAALQATLIWLFHQNLLMVVQMSSISAALLVIALLIYFPYHDRK